MEIIVEIPQGSRTTYEMDHDTGEMLLDRTEASAVVARSRDLHHPWSYPPDTPDAHRESTLLDPARRVDRGRRRRRT